MARANALRKGTKGPWYFPGSYWFPIAALYGAIVLPWSVLGQLGWVPAPAGWQGGLGHAHEMLFGFALAVVAGYALPPGKGRGAALLLLVWLAARGAFALAPASSAAWALGGLFVAGLAWLIAPTYLRASKWSNRSVAFIVLGLALSAVTFHALDRARRLQDMHAITLAAVLLLSMLMFFMGGRILAPAVAGHVRARGAPPLRHVVQPRLEGTVLWLLAASIAGVLLAWPLAHRGAGALLLCCVPLGLLRMGRWRCWLCRDQADLLALLAGYGWLFAGWLLTGLALLTGAPPTYALHAITVGALGTLTFSVSLRTQMFRATNDPNRLPWAYAGALLLGAAALLRITAASAGQLVAASACWSAAYALLSAVLVWLWWRKHGAAPRALPAP